MTAWICQLQHVDKGLQLKGANALNLQYFVKPARPQATVASEPFHQWTFPDGTLWTQFFHKDGGYLLRFPDLADFEVSANGGQVHGFPAPGVTPCGRRDA